MECKIFIVIARISYVLYLSHFIVQLQNIGQIRQPQYGNFFALVNDLDFENEKKELTYIFLISSTGKSMPIFLQLLFMLWLLILLLKNQSEKCSNN